HAANLEGGLDLEILERANNEIVRRHEVLRTRFVTEAGEPAQVIDEWAPRRLDIYDLTSLTQEEREREAQRIAMEETATGFDLSNGPLLRVKVLRLAEEQHLVLYTMHHIVSDAWSMAILIREMGDLYRAYSLGEPSPLAELPIQYADFAVWQRTWLKGERLERQLSYWRDRLAGLEPLNLPLDRPRPVIASHRGGIVPFDLSAEVTRQLVELSRREGVTLFMTVLAGFQLLLSRYCGQQDVAIGADIANRNRAETEGLIGFFVNQLVLRTDLSGNPSFRELLKRVREVTLGAYANQDLPFERLVEELQPERDLGRAPLFQVGLAFDNVLREGRRLGEQSGSIWGAEIVRAKHDLTFFAEESRTELRGAVEYARELFEESTIVRLTGHLRTVFEQVAANPEQAISEIDYLSRAEQDQILWEWNATTSSYPAGVSLHEMIERQVEKTPDAIALVEGQRSLSFEQLERSANRLGHYLQRLGAGPDVTIAVCMNRRIEMIVALVGILKAGGAYVPIDPKYPVERISFMLEDAEAAVLLTEESVRTSLPESRAFQVDLDAEWREIAGQSDERPETAVQAENLAYVIYTSGSTGRPKGVMVNHQSLVNYIEAVSRQLEMGAKDRVLQFASVSFDVAVEEIFPTLATGGAVVIDSRGVEGSFAELERVLSEEQISWVELPTAYWQAWVADLETRRGEISGSMRQVIVGGERMSPRSVVGWRRT
ncbi:MAG: AMP-binding protein, partial [Ktedonobacteraceae bacterium]|nr:AMP-binding protein [Ktedonobacteraceae bacterium]